MMVRLMVSGMSCGHCERAVEQALGEVPGVVRVVSVSQARGEAVVEGDPDPRALVEAVAEEGYQAEVA